MQLVALIHVYRLAIIVDTVYSMFIHSHNFTLFAVFNIVVVHSCHSSGQLPPAYSCQCDLYFIQFISIIQSMRLRNKHHSYIIIDSVAST